MSRPPKCRRVCFVPGATYFKPAGIPVTQLEENTLSVEEMEAIRLRDLEDLEQEQCAWQMNVSRPTFQRILAAARRKVADSLASGKALKIQGGNYEFAGSGLKCSSGHTWSASQAAGLPPGICPVCRERRAAALAEGSGENVGAHQAAHHKEGQVKVAVASEDGKMVSQHFGRATQYVVVKAERGRIVSRETRPKAGHADFGAAEHQAHQCGPDADAAAERHRHLAMARNILDCSTVLAGGMGYGAYHGLKERGIEPIITDVANIDEAIRLYLEGRLPNLLGRLH